MNYFKLKTEDVYTPEEVARKLKLSVATIYKLINEEKFPYFKVGKLYRIPSSALSQFIIKGGNLSSYLKSSPLSSKTIESFLGKIEKAPKKHKTCIVAVILFGSHARGDANEDSDIDLLVLTKAVTMEIQHFISEISSDAMQENDFMELLSPIRMSLSHWKELKGAGSPLYMEILSEGIVLWPNHLKSLRDIERGLTKS